MLKRSFFFAHVRVRLNLLSDAAPSIGVVQNSFWENVNTVRFRLVSVQLRSNTAANWLLFDSFVSFSINCHWYCALTTPKPDDTHIAFALYVPSSQNAFTKRNAFDSSPCLCLNFSFSLCRSHSLSTTSTAALHAANSPNVATWYDYTHFSWHFTGNRKKCRPYLLVLVDNVNERFDDWNETPNNILKRHHQKDLFGATTKPRTCE